MVHYFEQCRKINGEYYVGELRQLRMQIARKRRGKLTLGALLLQDNAPLPNDDVHMT